MHLTTEVSWIASYPTILHFKSLNNYYVAENKSCSSRCCHTGTPVPSNTNTKEKKGAITIFLWKERIQLWRPRPRYLNTPRLWAEPKIIHSVLCAKYSMQLPLTQPCSHVDKLSEATHAFTELKGPKDALEQAFFFHFIISWWQWLRFLQTHATNRYFGAVNSGFFPLFFH